MDKREHFLTCLGEEGNETAHRVSKALRFGLSEVQPGQHLSNAERIVEEAKDFVSVLIILEEEGILSRVMPSMLDIANKRAKIEKFMNYAREQGALT